MIKLIYCIRKRDDITTEEFNRYWLNDHAPRVASVAKTLGLIRYIQSHLTAPAINQVLLASRGLAPAFDGITEVWLESEQKMADTFSTPDGQAAAKLLIDDESKFIDFARSSVFMTTEHIIFSET